MGTISPLKRADTAALCGIASRVTIAVVLLLPGTARAAPETKPSKVGHVTVQAFADRHAIAPGDSVHLAVSLKIAEGWYVCWQNPGSIAGLPTRIRWTGPDGYLIGRVRFPAPQLKIDKTLKATSYIHKGTTLFLTLVRVPATAAPNSEATFTADVSWLACGKRECVPGRAEVSLTLPVVVNDAKAKLANQQIFEQARHALPVPTEKAEHVKLSGSVDKKTVKPGDSFTATLTAEIAPNHHMQSNKPFQEYLIPAVVFVELTDGFKIGEVEYPKPHVRNDKMLGKLSEYGGRIAFKIPVEVVEKADESSRWIRGVLQYQVCTDTGTCFPPQQVEFAIPVQMEGGSKPTESASGSAPQPETVAPEARTTVAIETEDATPTEGAKETREALTQEPEAASTMEAAGPAEDGRTALRGIEDWLASFGYIGVLVMALIGGIVLNLMPCVLPVISLKILSFVRQAREERARVFLLGLAYCAGILVFFTFLGILFWATGKGWGQLFQSPYVVLALAAIVTAFAMSLFGVFTVFTPKVISQLGEKAEGEGLLSSFFTGVLATFLGTACTAPFLGAAVGAAIKFEPYQGALIFFAVGVGMALPFFVLAGKPDWLKYVPRPGPWMGTFERLMGFLLLGTVIWLLNPLRGQLGDYGLLISLIFLLAVAIAVWIKGNVRFGDPPGRRLRLYTLALLILVIGWVLPFRFMATIPELLDRQMDRHELLALGEEYREREAQEAANPGIDNGQPAAAPPTTKTGPRKLDWAKGIPWRHYRRSRVLEDVRNGYTVFVDYTADWCINCKVNLKTSIDQPEVIALMKRYNVLPYEADYTLPVPEIKEDLKRFKRAGVPLYLVYKPGDTDNPEKLPEILTPGIVINALKRAGPSKVEP